MFRQMVFCAVCAAVPAAAIAQSKQSGDQSLEPQHRQQDRQQTLSGRSALFAQALYSGWRARQVVGDDVQDQRGRTIGSVQDIVVDKSGRAAAVIVEQGDGRNTIASSVRRIPWRELKQEQQGFTVDLSRSGQDEQGIVSWEEHGKPQEYRVSEVIGDAARLRTGHLFGYVTDIVFDDGDHVMAVIVSPLGTEQRDGTRQMPLAFTFHGKTTGRWEPGSSYFGLPNVTPQQARQSGLAVEPERFASDRASSHRQESGQPRTDDSRSPQRRSGLRDDTVSEPSAQRSSELKQED